MSILDLPNVTIEFPDRSSDGVAPIHIMSGQVLINGVRVMVEKDGIDIRYGPNEPTVVTLRILPTRVVFGDPTPDPRLAGESA